VNGIANLSPNTIGFRKAGLITSGFALVIGGLWTAVISQIGIGGFVNTLGATLAPLFGILMVDYFVVRKQVLSQEDLYNMDGGKYHYKNGWHDNAVIAFAIGAVFSVATVWLPMLSDLSGYAWIIGAALGAAVYYIRTKHMKLS
jgi:NCS1 family nucleobase:cation symporter-1